jgi:hypothetical protein
MVCVLFFVIRSNHGDSTQAVCYSLNDTDPRRRVSHLFSDSCLLFLQGDR